MINNNRNQHATDNYHYKMVQQPRAIERVTQMIYAFPKSTLPINIDYLYIQ